MLTTMCTAVSELSDLQKQSETLSRGIDFWNAVYLVTLLVALVIGALTLVATRVGIARTKKLGVINAEIARVKELQLQRDLKDKDSQIAKANEKVAEAELQIEKLRKANLVLIAAVADRHFDDQGGAAARLKQFEKVKVAIPYVQTDEALGTARQVAWTLWKAGWLLQPRAILPAEAISFGRGVTVCTSDESLTAARSALVDELNKTGITATSVTNSRTPPGMVIVLVGVKPNPLEEKFVQDAMDEVVEHPEKGLIETGNMINVP
jgi:hypothetical protein